MPAAAEDEEHDARRRGSAAICIRGATCCRSQRRVSPRRRCHTARLPSVISRAASASSTSSVIGPARAEPVRLSPPREQRRGIRRQARREVDQVSAVGLNGGDPRSRRDARLRGIDWWTVTSPTTIGGAAASIVGGRIRGIARGAERLARTLSPDKRETGARRPQVRPDDERAAATNVSDRQRENRGERQVARDGADSRAASVIGVS